MALNSIGLGVLLSVSSAGFGAFAVMKGGLSQTRDEMGRFGAFQKQTFEDAGRGLKIMSAGLVGLAAAFSTVPIAAEFGKQIARVRTVIDEAALSTQRARDATLGLAATYGISALQQAEGLYETISAGVTDAAKATDLLNVANQFAVGGTTALKGSVDVLTSAVNTYADTGLTAMAASDLMFTAIAAGKTTAEELSHSLGEVAPTAHAAGVSFAELQAAIAAMTVQGIKTSHAVTGLNALMSNLLKPTKDAADEAARLGIQFNATALKTKGLKGVLDQLIGNTKIQDDSFGKLFGSIDGIKAALSLTSGDGAKFNEILGQMEGSAGATKKAFDVMANTTAFQGRRFAALAENAKILIGQALEPLAASIMGVGNSVLEAFGRVPKPIRDFVVQAFAAASAAVAVAGAVLAAKSAFLIGAAALKAFGVGAVGSLLASLGPVVAVLGAVGLAILAFRQAVQSNLGGVADAFAEFFGGVRLAFEALGQLFSQGGFSGKVRDEFLKGDNAFVNFALKVFLVVERIKNFFSGLAEGFSNAAAKIDFGKLLAALAAIGSAIGLLSNDAEASGRTFDAFGAAGSRVGDVLGQVAGVVVALLTAAANVVAGFASAWHLVSAGLDEALDALREVFSALGDIVGSLLGASTEGLTAASVFRTVGQAVGVVFATALKLAAAAVRILANLLKDVASVVRGVVDVIAGILTGDWTRVWNGLKEVVFGVVSAIVSVMLGLVEAIAAVIDQLGNLAGKDFGFARQVSGFRDTVRASMRETMGLEGTVTVRPSAPPIPNAGGANASPMPAAAAQPNASFDPALVSSAAASAATAAVSRAPAPPINVTLKVGEEVLARAAIRGRESSAAASYEPQAMSSEG